VRRPDLARGEQIPLRIEPERGKIAKDSGEPKAKVAGDVLEKGERGSGFDQDSGNVRPQMPRVFLALTFAGNGEGLAGIPGRDQIHTAEQRAAVEGSKIRPHRRRIQPPFFHL
jgi:hypothetical protein